MKLTKRNDVDFSGDVLTYDSAQESNPRFKHEATVSAGYTELTSISDWTTYGTKAIDSYKDFRNELIANFIDWATYSNDDKKRLMQHYVWPSTETTANLDLLYTQTERDEFVKACASLLNEDDSNFHMAPDGKYWGILPGAAGSLITTELKTDEVLGASIGGGAEWLDLNRSSTLGDQTGIDGGVDIIMDSSRGNGITYNGTTGVVTLKAGRIYRLWATFAMFSLVNNNQVAIQWVNSSDNLPLVVGHETRIREPESTSNGNTANTIEVIFNPTVDTDVKLRCISYSGTPDTVTMYWERSMATVIELR